MVLSRVTALSSFGNNVCTIQYNLCRTATLKEPKIGFQDQLSLNAGLKYCRMPQYEHSAIRLTFIKLPFVIKNFVLSIFEWPFLKFRGFTVYEPAYVVLFIACAQKPLINANFDVSYFLIKVLI